MTDTSTPPNTLPEPALTIDASGLKCPLPILRAKKALAQVGGGDVLMVITTDVHAVRDFQAFAQQTGHTLLAQRPRTEDDATEHWLQRRHDR